MDKNFKNQLYDAIRVTGLDPRECQLEERDDVAAILHRLTDSTFVVTVRKIAGGFTRYETYMSICGGELWDWACDWPPFPKPIPQPPGVPAPSNTWYEQPHLSDRVAIEAATNWAGDVMRWLDQHPVEQKRRAEEQKRRAEEQKRRADEDLAEYLATPDLWALVAKPASGNDDVVVAIEGMPNRHFTAAELIEIAARIAEIKERARGNPELTDGQIRGIEQKLDDLKEASERVGRKDWLTMLYGAAFGMIVNDLVPPHVVQGIITTVITGLGHIFGLGGAPAPLPPQA